MSDLPSKTATTYERTPRFAREDATALLQTARAVSGIVRHTLKPLRLRPESWLILEALSEGRNSASELATAVAGLRGSISRWLSSLQRVGFVECRVSAGDQRQKILSITAIGDRQLQLARRRIEDALQQHDLPFDENGRQAMNGVNRRLQWAPGGTNQRLR